MILNALYSALVESSKAGEPLLTVREIAVLLHLRGRVDCSTGEIAHALYIPKAAVTRAVDMLEGSLLAHRKRNPDDMRFVRVRLSLQGLAYLERLERRLAPAKTKAAA